MPSLYRGEDVFARFWCGGASRTRTGTVQFRKLVLCPIELRPQRKWYSVWESNPSLRGENPVS